MDRYTHQIHGLSVSSEFPLDAPPAEGPPELAVEAGPPAPCSGRPEGRLLMDRDRPYPAWMSYLADGSGQLLRLCEAADFTLTPDRIKVQLTPDRPEGYAALLVSGVGLAFWLTLRGAAVLHASAIETPFGAVAFVGYSGAGKSTTIAQLCLAGAPLLTDDTLAIELGDGSRAPRAFRGTEAVRLRESAAELLADRLDLEGMERSVDERLIFRPGMSEASELPLRAIVAIERNPDPGPPELMRLAGAEAVTVLVQNPRVLGWVEESLIKAEFARMVRLASEVAVYRVVLPPPGTPGVGERLSELLRELGEDPGRP